MSHATIPTSPATGPDSLPIVDAAILGERLGRLFAGGTLVVGAAATVVASFVDGGSPRATLLLAWIGAAVAFVVGRSVGRGRRLDPGLVRRSLCVPVIGVSLTAPLTMHALLSFAMGASADDFRGWVLISLALTTQSHLILAALASRTVLRHLGGRSAPTTTELLMMCVASAVLPIGALALGDIDEILPLAVLAVAGQILVLGPVFMVPMMRLARHAAEVERGAHGGALA